MLSPEALVKAFYESCERQALAFGYKTRDASSKPWADVPEQNKSLMVAVSAELLTMMRAEFADYLRKTWDRFQINSDEGHILEIVARDIEKGK